jgi:hypothetical protein
MFPQFLFNIPGFVVTGSVKRYKDLGSVGAAFVLLPPEYPKVSKHDLFRRYDKCQPRSQRKKYYSFPLNGEVSGVQLSQVYCHSYFILRKREREKIRIFIQQEFNGRIEGWKIPRKYYNI